MCPSRLARVLACWGDCHGSSPLRLFSCSTIPAQSLPFSTVVVFGVAAQGLRQTCWKGCRTTLPVSFSVSSDVTQLVRAGKNFIFPIFPYSANCSSSKHVFNAVHGGTRLVSSWELGAVHHCWETSLTVTLSTSDISSLYSTTRRCSTKHATGGVSHSSS